MQALIAAGRKVWTVRRDGSRTPAAYLRSLTGPDGAVRYSRTLKQTPVWVTGQALTALAGKPFPLARVARVARIARPARVVATVAATATPTPRPTATVTARPTPSATPQPRRSAISEAAVEALARRAGITAGLLTTVIL
jgi:hypothetical protein